MTKYSSGAAIAEETDRLLRPLTPENVNRIILLNRPFVIRIAKQHLRDGEAAGQELIDLIQEGTFGLRIAAERFDPSRGVKFTTLAGWWVRSSVMRLIHDNAAPFVGKVHSRQLHRRTVLAYAEKKFLSKHGREPTQAELLLLTHMTAEEFEKALLERSVQAYSIDAPSKDGEPIRDSVAHCGVGPESEAADLAARKEARRLLSEMVDYLRSVQKPRNVKIFEARLKLDGSHPYEKRPTLEALGKEHHLTKERIRQILETCMRLLRKRYRHDLDKMKDLLDTFSSP